MNTFGLLLRICGLTAHDAAHLLKTPPRVVMQWERGTHEPPAEAITALGALQARQQDVADAIIAAWDEAGRGSSMSIAIARDDAEAREVGWPSLAAQTIPAAIAQGVLGPVRIDLDQGHAAGPNPAAVAAE